MAIQEGVETYDDESKLHMCNTFVFFLVSACPPSVSDASGAKEHKKVLSRHQRPPEQFCRSSARFCKFCKLQA